MKTSRALDHPSADTLRAYAAGKLDKSAAAAVLTHLESCFQCCKNMATLSGDQFREQGHAGKGSHTPASNKTLEQYQIIRELGRGGMGVVYLAKDSLMDRLEVLKVVNRQVLDHAGGRERFLREIRSAAKLSHPNIVTAYAAFEIAEVLLLSMEYVDGEDLAKVVKGSGPLSVPIACLYVQQTALGLQHAFEKGMVHRDIKPQNLILTVVGKKRIVKILDFGLAKATRDGQGTDHELTATGMMLGTPHYIAPEQALDAASADIRADIYSLGCTMYFLLTGRAPFEAKSVFELVNATPLDQMRADIPPEIAGIVAKMMAKSPAARYQKPIEVGQALAPFVKPRKTTPVDEVGPEHKPVRQGKDKSAESNTVAPAQFGTIMDRESIIVGPRRQPTQLTRWRLSRRYLITGGIGIGLLFLALALWASGAFGIRKAEEARAGAAAKVELKKNGLAVSAQKVTLEDPKTPPPVPAIDEQPSRREVEAKAREQFNLGEALRQKGAFDAAVTAYREALRLKPDYYDAVIQLGAALCDHKKDYAGAIGVFSKAVEIKPENALGHHHLGVALGNSGASEKAIDAFKQAVRLSPNEARYYSALGQALNQKGALEDAVSAYREAVRLKPDYYEALINLGIVLCDRTKDYAGAITVFGKATELKPKDAVGHHNLGVAFRKSGAWDKAVGAFKQASRLNPKEVRNHWALADALVNVGALEDAVKAYQAVIEINPRVAGPHFSLAWVFGLREKLGPAASSYQEAIRLNPDFAEAHCNLGGILRRTWKPEESLASYRRGHELGSKRPDWSYPSAMWVADAERLVRLAGKRVAIFNNQVQPADAAERVGFAQLCYCSQLYASSARHYEKAFEECPQQATERHYDAGSSAARAGTGQGKDAAALTENERARLRKLALKWLQIDLVNLEKKPHMARSGQLSMRRIDPVLASVRNPAELAKLPAEERKSWQEFWASVDKLLLPRAGE
jgi:serine/threonine protein kinase/tetratricopeptide (TPR) repeat protein